MTEFITGRELAQKIYDQVTRHPETHDQAEWWNGNVDNCGTTRCIAGWAVHFNKTPEEHADPCRGEAEALSRVCGELDLSCYGIPYAQVAAELLELDELEAERLFYRLTNSGAAAFLLNHFELED